MSETSVAVPETAGAAQAYILFGVAGTTYAIRSHEVLHVEMIEHVTPVPNAPAFVEGVVFSRGQVVPVINLRARFGFERAAMTQRSRLLGARLRLLEAQATKPLGHGGLGTPPGLRPAECDRGQRAQVQHSVELIFHRRPPLRWNVLSAGTEELGQVDPAEGCATQPRQARHRPPGHVRLKRRQLRGGVGPDGERLDLRLFEEGHHRFADHLPEEVTGAVDGQHPPVSGQHFSADEVHGKGVPPGGGRGVPGLHVVRGSHAVPVDRRLTEKDTDAPVLRQ